MNDRATAYAESVVKKTIDRAVGKTEVLACKRHLNDLEKQDTEDFPFVWDEKKSLTMIDFSEQLILAEGSEKRPFIPAGFQSFVMGNWQGWTYKNTGYRRFRTSYIQIGRQNGKSVLNAVPSIYYGNFAGYQYPQIYCVATKQDQAKIVLKECYKFLNSDAELCGTKTKKGLFTIQDYKSEIQCNLTNGIIKALGRDTDTIDGFRPYFASVDEYHRHKTSQMYRLLADGDKKMKECLVSIITTAGFDLNSPCKTEYDFGKSILNGFPMNNHFVFICEPDKEDLIGDKIWDESIWPKAHPLWTPETLISLRTDADGAREKGGEDLRNYLTKDLDIWVQATDDQYLDAGKWNDCGSNTTLEDMRGRECWLGLDLSSGGDLTSGNLEFPLDIDGRHKNYIHSHSFLPKERLSEHIKTGHAPYDMWAKDDLLTLTEGENGGYKLDYKHIIHYYKDIINKYDLKLKAIAYDPHNADAFLSDLSEFGVDLVMIVQSARFLNDATADFKFDVDAGNVIYDKKNTLLTWSMHNARVVHNSFGEIKIDKETRPDKIDPCDAVICSHKLAMTKKPKYNPNDYANDDILKKLWS